MIESLFEKQQNPLPGPLDAMFHVLLLAAGNQGAMNPQAILNRSGELDCSQRPALKRGFYTDIPPKLEGTPEEIVHTIEVAVRRSFDFMKCPLILGGDSSIIPAIISGIRGQVAKFELVPLENISTVSSPSIVVTIDGDRPSTEYMTRKWPVDQIKAIIVTGTERADLEKLLTTILDLCDQIEE